MEKLVIDVQCNIVISKKPISYYIVQNVCENHNSARVLGLYVFVYNMKLSTI